MFLSGSVSDPLTYLPHSRFFAPLRCPPPTSTQDPSYPVYVDTSVMVGQTGEIHEDTMQYDNIVYMPCSPSNDFFPDLKVNKRRRKRCV